MSRVEYGWYVDVLVKRHTLALDLNVHVGQRGSVAVSKDDDDYIIGVYDIFVSHITFRLAATPHMVIVLYSTWFFPVRQP
jgi:hypothetical protein